MVILVVIVAIYFGYHHRNKVSFRIDVKWIAFQHLEPYLHNQGFLLGSTLFPGVFLEIFKKNRRGTRVVREKLVLMIAWLNLLRYAET